MAKTVADFMLSRFSEWGVTRLYGYPGDGINGILVALDRALDRFQRHSWPQRMPNSLAEWACVWPPQDPALSTC